MIYPRQSPTTHTEQLGDEASVYDWARAQVHALNPTAAHVWRLCDGATSPAEMAAAVQREMELPEAETVVDLALTQLARLHLLEQPVEPGGNGPATTRRWLLQRGVAAAMLPAIYSIVAPSPVDAQSPGPNAPTLTSIAPNTGTTSSTVAVTLTGTKFVGGATTVTVSGTGVTVANVTVANATSLTANFVVDATAAAGARTVSVATALGTSGAQTFTVTQPATLSSLSPNQGLQGSTVAVTLTGTNFVAGATTVAVAGGGVTVSAVTVASATSLTANFVLDPAAAEGPRAVTAATAAGTSGAQTFTVTVPLPPGTPTLTGISPNQGVRGTTVAVTLTGTNFVPGATTVAVGGGGATVTSVVVSSATSLTANFVLDPAAADGARTVTVTTAFGTSGPQFFTIGLGAPTLTGITPNEGIQGTPVAVTLTGTNFVAGATTVAVSGAGVTVTNVVVGSGTSLTASFVPAPAAATGPRAVTVTTAAGTSGAQTFTIDLPPGAGTPTLTSIAPNQGIRGNTVAVTLTGTNFVVGATSVTVAGGGVTVTGVTVASTTSLTASFVLDAAAIAGPRNVTVMTSGGTSGPQGFLISLPPPTLTSVAPNQGIRGETVAVTLTGTNFLAGATTVAVLGGGVAVANVVVGSSTSLTANFVLDLAADGPRTVTVTTGGGTSSAQTFTIALPLPGSRAFVPPERQGTFVVPAGVSSLLIEAVGARGGAGFPSGNPGNGGRAVARFSVVPGRVLTVRVGGLGAAGVSGSTAVGGFNGGGPSTGDGGGGGGGASSVRDGADTMMIAGGGGGGGIGSTGGGGNGGHGGGLSGGDGATVVVGGRPGIGGSQSAGGAGGAAGGSVTATSGTAGNLSTAGTGGSDQPGVRGGGGGGGGYFGGGGGGGGTDGTGGGGGGSSFTAPGATDVLHQQGSTFGNSVTFSW